MIHQVMKEAFHRYQQNVSESTSKSLKEQEKPERSVCMDAMGKRNRKRERAAEIRELKRLEQLHPNDPYYKYVPKKRGRPKLASSSSSAAVRGTLFFLFSDTQ